MATNTPGVLDDSTADFTWALILSTARRVVESDAHVRAGDGRDGTSSGSWCGRTTPPWASWASAEIGKGVARRAIGFDMKVLHHDSQRADAETERSCKASYVSMDELLSAPTS
jgi:gluconate 2-dehydrogenase